MLIRLHGMFSPRWRKKRSLHKHIPRRKRLSAEGEAGVRRDVDAT